MLLFLGIGLLLRIVKIFLKEPNVTLSPADVTHFRCLSSEGQKPISPNNLWEIVVRKCVSQLRQLSLCPPSLNFNSKQGLHYADTCVFWETVSPLLSQNGEPLKTTVTQFFNVLPSGTRTRHSALCCSFYDTTKKQWWKNELVLTPRVVHYKHI